MTEDCSKAKAKLDEDETSRASGEEQRVKTEEQKDDVVGGEDIFDADEGEAVEDVKCISCANGGDEDSLILCDGCDCAQHTFCARPPLNEVPPGQWFCELCTIKAHIRHTSPNLRIDASVLAELNQPSHAVRDLWAFKVPHALTSCQLLRHIIEFSAALDRVKLKPLAEEVAELNRLEKVARREQAARAQQQRREHAALEQQRKREQVAQERAQEQQERAQEQQRRRAEQAEHKELVILVDHLIKHVVANDKADAKEAARLARERARQEAHNERQALRNERATQKIDAEVSACLERLLGKVIKMASQARPVREPPRLTQPNELALYCVCRKPYNPTWVYISCDVCDEWFHGKCIGLSPKQVAAVDQFVCETCEANTGNQTTWKVATAASPAPPMAKDSKRRASEMQEYPRVRLRLGYPLDYKAPYGKISVLLHGACATHCGSVSPADLPIPSLPPPSLPPSPPGSPVSGATDHPPFALPPLLNALSGLEHEVEEAPAELSVQDVSTAPPIDDTHIDDLLPVSAMPSEEKPVHPGAQVECALQDPGMRGSWYVGKVVNLSADGDTAMVSIPVLQDDLAQRDALTEQLPLQALRPIAPPAEVGFIEQLKVGGVAELWWQEGWWQVIVKNKPSSNPAPETVDASSSTADAACTSGESTLTEWSLESIQYGNCHRLADPILRPCWCWQPDEHRWTSIERAPSPPPAPKAAAEKRAPQERDSNTERDGKAAPVEKKSKRKSEFGSGPKDAQREEIERKALLQQYAVGQHVEVRGLEEGFLGSWYKCRVLELQEARSGTRLRLCYLAFQEEDGSLWEDWFEQQHVRPMPPDHDPTFITKLKKGSPLEINIEEGWWEVEFCGRDGPNYVVAAKRYNVQHVVPLASLRPAWCWSQPETSWSELKKLPLAKDVSRGSGSKAPRRS